MNNKAASPPIAEAKPFTMTIHGHERVDNYFWLNERDNQEVIDYLEAENAYTKAVMQPAKTLEDGLFEEMKGRIKENDTSYPYKKGNYWYYTKYVEGGEYPIYCRKMSLDGKEEIMLDGNEMGKGKSFFQFGGWEISDDESLIVFSIDTIGRRNYTLHIKDLKTGKILEDKIENTEGYAYAWAADNKSIFYMTRDPETLLASKIFKHELGTDVGKDKLMYEEKDNEFYLWVYRSKSGKYIVSESQHIGVSTEYRLLDADNPNGSFKVFYPREKNHEYFIEHGKGEFFILSNRDGAENFKLLSVPENAYSDPANWATMIEHSKDTYLNSIEVFNDYLTVEERRNAIEHIRVINLHSKEEHYIEFDEEVYTIYTSQNEELDSHSLRLFYASMTTPWRTFDYDMNKRTLTLRKEKEIPGGYDRTQYKTERLWATAEDGTNIPISIVYKKGFEKNGEGNILQYGYGSYGSSLSPYFSTTRLSLLDRGFAFAMAHIRGGSEMGRQWYEQGRKKQKMNTFTDFIDCSTYLIENNWTSPEHLFIAGGSAGGLLMGSVINLRPDLYKGALAAVPFVDVVTTMLDDTIPLTTGEYQEWGNPNIKEDYEYMLSYSPYDNVEKKDYPNLLITAGLHDSQVQYFEAAKWAAKLRKLKTDDNILLLYTNMSAGHGGSSGRFAGLKDTAMEYAFILNLSGFSK